MSCIFLVKFIIIMLFELRNIVIRMQMPLFFIKTVTRIHEMLHPTSPLLQQLMSSQTTYRLFLQDIKNIIWILNNRQYVEFCLSDKDGLLQRKRTVSKDFSVYSLVGACVNLEIGLSLIRCNKSSILKYMSTSDVCISSSILDLTPKSFRRIIKRARRGLAAEFQGDSRKL